ncbi:MAG TPA: nuclear transport factor 2 family protein [Spongiibacteraceae bacterium]|nr:nuclear transport factor 2 family protein [Spongiibacteraceae bacterium]
MNRQFIEAYYAAYNSEDPTLLQKFYADDVVLISAQGELRGAAAILATYRFLTEQFYDRMTPEQIVIDGNTAVVDIIDIFTAKRDVADFMGMALRAGETLELRLRGTYTVAAAVNDKKFTRIVIELLA